MANPLSLAGPGSKYQLPNAWPAGFLSGLWHGFILVIAFLVSLFNPQIRIYEKNNVGRLYDFGFLIGMSLVLDSTRLGSLEFGAFGVTLRIDWLFVILIVAAIIAIRQWIQQRRNPSTD